MIFKKINNLCLKIDIFYGKICSILWFRVPSGQDPGSGSVPIPARISNAGSGIAKIIPGTLGYPGIGYPDPPLINITQVNLERRILLQ